MTMITLSSQAEIALQSLLPSDRERVDRFLNQLDNFPEYINVANNNVKLLKSEDLETLYMARVSPNFRIVLRRADEGVEVIDIFFKKDDLRTYKKLIN